MFVIQKKEDRESPISPKIGFTFTYVSTMNASLLFGGSKDNDIVMYDHKIDKRVWNTKTTTGTKKPPSRKFHAAAFIQSAYSLLVTGGLDDLGHCLEDFYLLSLRDWKWRKLIYVKFPAPRQRHALIPKTGNQLVMFGGISPYNEKTNDIWLLKIHLQKGQTKNQSYSLECYQEQFKGKIVPQGRCLAESTILINNKLYVGAYEIRNETEIFGMYCYQFKISQWKRLDIKFTNSRIRLFRTVNKQQQTFILSSSSKQNHSASFIFNQARNNLTSIKSKNIELMDNCDGIVLDGAKQSQIACLLKGKKLSIANFWYEAIQQPPVNGTIEDYLIAIKHQQILSQELIKKNVILEQLYKQMQNYITQLHKQYVRFQEDQTVEAEKVRHIQDCRHLKVEYCRLDELYEEIGMKVRELRGELGNINQDFERCMETQFDEQA